MLDDLFEAIAASAARTIGDPKTRKYRIGRQDHQHEENGAARPCEGRSLGGQPPLAIAARGVFPLALKRANDHPKTFSLAARISSLKEKA